ncbi:hypothetical protein SAMN05444411_101474 [Lutibacter oricola]|uniref:Uncharacterized protein n=1 Tax=Lutibacter oricola TaxID=762486 RepID=A0A1H2SJY6_9FLAO|nr:hypothetical protein [Lutibacter oricola]SDW31946.1 hypothetical protein SAMN05444411_101474 [Lutibacter oricola]
MKPLKSSYLILLLLSLTLINCTNSEEKKENNPRYPVLMNMVHHNPGEPRFNTKYTEPAYIKKLGYNGQVPKFEIQCAVTYDDYEANLVPDNTPEKLWIERKAHDVRIMLENAKRTGMPIYPFTDVLVVPKSVMEKYGDEMKEDGRLSIHKPRTQEILKAQIAEIFKKFPELGGLTIRFGETYLHDTPFHTGNRPVYGAEDHKEILNLLREEVCVKRNKKLFYRTWDWGKIKKKFHLRPDVYLEITNAVEPHPNLYFSIKHVNGDFLRDLPFNKTIGIGKHQQIVEVSINQAGMYGRNAHPYYIGKGVTEGWPEMKEKKGLRDLYENQQVKGIWTWTWGDGWYGPYFGNEFWMDLNEYIIREFAKNPLKTEEELFNEYAQEVLKMSSENIKKLRELCLLSVNAVFKGQATSMQYMQPWWIRDHFFSAQDMSIYVKKGIANKVLKEKKENLKQWYKMEDIANSISLPNKEDEQFIKVSTTYGRIKYELIELIFRTQIMFAQLEKGKPFNKEEAKLILDTYDQKWNEWRALKKNNSCCPTLYVDYEATHCQGNKPFITSIKKLEQLLVKNN